MDIKDIQNRFTYHAPKSDQLDKYTEIRVCALNFAIKLNMLCPDSREKSLTITALEEAVFWANASIARKECRCNLEIHDTGKKCGCKMRDRKLLGAIVTRCKYCDLYDGGWEICLDCLILRVKIKDNPEAAKRVLKEYYTTKEKMNGR